jgi:acetyl esterase/lipase
MSINNPRIDIRKSLSLGSAGDRPLLGDLYLPGQSDGASRPALVLIFGGGWKSGERSQQKIYGLALAQAGFVCLATDYRLSSEARWPAQLDDVQSAIRWLRRHSEEFSIDPERIAVSGNSSGGHLALMAAATGDVVPASQDEVDASDLSGKVSAVCAFYPPTRLKDLDAESEDDTVATLLGAGATAADYDRASPLSYASKPFPPVLLLIGSDDQRVPVEHGWRLHDALQKAGNTVDLHVFAGQGHAFDVERNFARLSAVIMADFFSRYV